MNNVAKHLVILFLYTVLTCLLLYPLPIHLSTGLLEAQSGDPLMQIWVMQWNVHKLTTSLSHYFDANIFYPYPNTFAYHDHMFGLGVLGLPIYLVTHNPILTYNLLLILAFILSAYGMYLLCNDITCNHYAAFLAGFIFGFLPYRFAHLDHLNLLSIQWLPFCLLFLTRFLFSPPPVETFRWNVSTITLFWLFFLFQALTSFNYLFMLTFTVGLYLVTIAAVQFIGYRRQHGIFLSKQKVALLMIGGCLIGLILLPFTLPYLKANRDMGFQRTWQEAESLSARIQDYFVTPETNFLYGQFTRKFQSLRSPFPREQMLFNGLLPIFLALWGIFGGRGKRRKAKGERRFIFIVLLLVAGVLSFGPSVTVFGKSLPLPYAWLYNYVPGFKSMRVPARFGLLVSFALVVLASIGLAQLYNYVRQWKGSRNHHLKDIVVTGVLGGIILLEYYSPPKDLNFYPGTKEAIPAVYQWLAQQPNDIQLIELPVRSAKDDFEYTYYSTFHWKRMVNGRSAFIPNGITQIFSAMRAFPSLRTIELLQTLGVEYVIWHTEKLAQSFSQPLPKGVKVLQAFDHDMLLEISTETPGVSQNSGSLKPQHLNIQYHIPTTLRPNEQYLIGISLQANNQESWTPLPQEKATVHIEWRTATQAVFQESREIVLPIFMQSGEGGTFPLVLTTPAAIDDYQVVLKAIPSLFQPTTLTKRVTLVAEMLDSRKPGKLQAEFLQVDIPEVWEHGKPLPIRVLVKNSGDTLWKAKVADRAHPVGEVHLGVRDWQDMTSGQSLQTSHPQLFVSRGFLPYDIAPGNEVSITAEIRTPDVPGEFLVQLDLVSELIQWFSDQGSQPFKKKIILK